MDDQQYISDLEDLAKQWANAYSAKNGTTCEWVDINAKKPEMAQYQQYKISTQVINVRYEGAGGSMELPGSIVEDTTINDSSLSQKAVFRHTKETTSTFTWRLKEGIKTGKDVAFTVGVPPAASRNINSSEILTETTVSQTKNETKTWSIERHVSVPAQSKMDMIWTVKEEETSGTFYADVFFTGHFAIWNTDEVDINDPDGDDEHYLWFTPIMKAFGQMKEWGIPVPPQYTIIPGAVIYRVSGECKGVSGYDTSFVLKETPLKATKSAQPCRCVTAVSIPADN